MKLAMLAKMGLTVALAAAATVTLARPATAAQEPKQIEITAKRFSFTPSELTLKKGEPVVLVFHAEDVAHGIKFEELGVQTDIPKGQQGELKFTPDKAGDFVGHCSHFCGEGHGSMSLTLHVAE